MYIHTNIYEINMQTNKTKQKKNQFNFIVYHSSFLVFMRRTENKKKTYDMHKKML